MSLERAHRLDREAPRLPDDPLVAELLRDDPGRRTLVELEALIARFGWAAVRRAARQVPGRRTLVELAARLAREDAPAAGFEAFRARGLRELLRVAESHGGSSLLRATLGAAEPEIARAAHPARVDGPAAPTGGPAIWRASERYAATLYRRAMDAGEVDRDDPAVVAALARCGTGEPLAPDVRRAMEARLGVSLGGVRIHRDAVAAEAARAVHAEAFTVGEDIFFAAGAYAPDTHIGQRLLAHELAHVVQARQGRLAHDGQVSKPGDALEREADAVAEGIAAPASPAPVAPAALSGPAPAAPAAGPLGSVTRPAALSPASSQPLLRKAAAPRGRKPQTRAGAGKSPNKADQKMHGVATDFAHRAGRAGDHAAGHLKHGLAHVKADPPGKRAHDHAKREHRDAHDQAAHAHRLEQHLRGQKADAHAVAPAPAAVKVPAGTDPRSPIQLRPISDWSKFLPAPLPDQDDRERKRLEELVKRKIEGERGDAQRAFEQLRAAHLAKAREIRAMKPKLEAQVAAAQKKALAHVASAESSQAGAVQGHIAAVQGQVRGHAGAMKSKVIGAHTAAVAKINAAYQEADQQLTDKKTKALSDVDATVELAVITMCIDYLIVQGRFSALGSSKAADAITVGNEEAGKLGGQYEGDKLEAAQKAARECADGFATSMPEQTAASYEQLAKTRPEAEKGLRDFAKVTRENVNKTYDAAKQVIDQIHTQSIQAADAAKNGAIAQIDAACGSTVAAIAAQGAAQIAAIHQQARGARTGILQGGAAARQGVVHGCDQAASGIEGGIAGLISGAKQIEAPDPEQTRAQVQQGAASLATGANGASKGLAASATKAGDGLTQQATATAAGMAQIAHAAQAAATQLGAGAKQQMSGTASGASQALTQVVTAHKTSTDKTMTSAGAGFDEQVKALSGGYDEAAKERRQGFANNVNEVATNLDKTVPARGGQGGGAGSGKKEEGGEKGGGPSDEIGAIQAAAKKAADAVKPWWQKALAIVVSVVVAVVVVLVVTALIATTGPVGMILVGALAGALASVASQMASNLVLGKGVMDDITWKTVAIGAVSGAIGAGLTSAVGAGAKALAGEASTFARGASATAKALGEDGAKTLAGYSIRAGIGFGTDVVSDQASQLIFNHQFHFSIENLVLSLVTNAAQSHPKFDTFQNNVQKAVQNKMPFSVKVPGLQIALGHPKVPTGDIDLPAAGDEGGVHVPEGGHGAPARSTTGGGGEPGVHPTGDGGGSPPKVSADGGGGGGAPTRRPGDTGNQQPHPAGEDPPARGPGEEPHPANDNSRPSDPKKPGEDGKKPGEDPSKPGDDGKKPGEDPSKPGEDGKKPGEDSTKPGEDGKKPGEDGKKPGEDPSKPGEDGKKPGEDPSKPGEDGKKPGEDGQKPGDGKPGDGKPGDGKPGDDPHHAGDPDAPHARDHDGPAPHDTTGGPDEAAARAHDAEMTEIGYPEGTRAKGEELAGHIEQGGKPPKNTVRDTAANQDGVLELQRIHDDRALTPEEKAKLRHDIATEVRSHPEPTGRLPRDIQEARAHEATDARPPGTHDPGGPGHPPGGHDAGGPGRPPGGHDPAGPAGDGAHEITAAAVPDSSFHGQGKARSRPKTNIKAGLKALRKLAREQGLKLEKVPGADDTFRVTTPEGETFTVKITSEALSGTEVANTIINTKADEHVIRISDRADDGHVERAIAHELAEIQEVRVRAQDGRATDPKHIDDVLARGSTPTELSPHDRGRLAELEVLRKQREDALATGDRDKVANINREMQALIEHLGLRDGTPGADARRGLVTDKDLSAETRTLLDELRRPISDQTPEALGMTPGNGKLVLGDGTGRRVIDMDHVEALVDEVHALADPDLMAAAQRLAAAAEARARAAALAAGKPWPPTGARRPARLDEFEPLYHIREALLVEFRNNRAFRTSDPHQAMKDLMKAMTERLELIENVAKVDWDDDVIEIARTHPERDAFYEALDGIVPPHEIDQVWALVVQGVHEQKRINDAGLKGKVENPYYKQLADKMSDLLRPGDNVMPTLWSGGYDVSVYAQNRGFRTLEATQAGRLFDQLKLFQDFSTLGPLWNEISTKFVDAFAGDVHVFVRTMDKGSVLFRQELEALMKLEGIISIRWHVLAGDDLSNLTEIDAAGNPAPGHTFDGYRDAARAMGDDAFRAPDLPGEPKTPAEVRERMLEEQRKIAGYVADLKQFVDDQVAALGIDRAAHGEEVARLLAIAELRLRNNPASGGVKLDDIFAQLRLSLGRDLLRLSGGSAGGTP